MEDAYALIVLTLLQLCRGEISPPEWFAANLINDPGYTPKPITEIFTSDSTSKSPALFTQPTTSTTAVASSTIKTSTPFTTTVQNVNLPIQQIQSQGSPIIAGQTIQQQPVISQVADDSPRTELPSFVIIFDPKRQVNQNFQSPFITSSPTTANPPASLATQPTTSTDTTMGTEPTSTFIPTQDTTIQSNPQQVPSGSSPPFWPPGSLFVYPIQLSNSDPIINATAPISEAITSTLPPQPARPLITVRLKSPKGSITNIKINPTTTVRPTTTRRRKQTKRSNNYEICLNSCNGTKEPICSSPMGVYPVDPERLKGFASLCHMACHNSFRREQVYEKIADGRCGRLRTRIRPVDKNKLNRDELNKAQYTITHNGPETVMEFSPLRR